MVQYPKEMKLKGGGEVVLRPLAKGDAKPLLEFFRSVPEDERLFFKQDVTSPGVIERWTRENTPDNVFCLVGDVDGKIICDATLHFRSGWFRHMAEVRCVVAKDYRRKGLGKILVHELLGYANQKGVDMIVAQIMETQKTALSAFEKMGFSRAAVLENFVVDIQGTRRNLVMMLSDTTELWKKMEDMFVDYDKKTMW